MKLALLPKYDKENIATSKKLEDDAMSVNCDVIVVFYLSSNWRDLETGFLIQCL